MLQAVRIGPILQSELGATCWPLYADVHGRVTALLVAFLLAVRPCDLFRARDYRLPVLCSIIAPAPIYVSLPAMRLRERLLRQARGGHDHLTTTTLPVGCSSVSPDAGANNVHGNSPAERAMGRSTPSGWWAS